MVKLFIIADDFTGALDTGVQFAGQGACTKIAIGKEAEELQLEQENVDVIVIDAETRHLSKEEAYRRVVKLAAKALKEQVPYIFKKTDSALRGNIGMELAALIEVSDEKFLPFIPAFPAMKRFCKKGVYYIDGVPITKTVFGSDPFEPVSSSLLEDLFVGTGIHTEVLQQGEEGKADYEEPTIGIYDAETMQDIINIVRNLKQQEKLRIMAGCAGLAAVLPKFIGIATGGQSNIFLNKPLLVVCGSLNPISKKQLEYGASFGFPRFIMEDKIQKQEGYLDTSEGRQWVASIQEKLNIFPVVMVDTGVMRDTAESDSCRVKIAALLGRIVKMLVKAEACNTVMVIGGDTLLGFVEQSACKEITLIGEIKTGTVVSSMLVDDKKIWVLSKSGGFGDEKLVVEVAEELTS